jgi:hypothetical protein
MVDWAQILVIILSIVLALFLIVGVILGLMLVRLTKQIRMIAAAAERTVEGFERAAHSARLASIPTMIIGRVLKFMKKEKRHGSK